jgi:hypothetical protein
MRRSHFSAEEEVLHEIENQPQTSTRRFANHLRVSQFVVWLRVQNAAQEIRQNRAILAGILSNFFDVSFYTFTHSYSLFTLLFKPFLNKLQALFYHHFTNFIKDS